jgi:hypothetical protein
VLEVLTGDERLRAEQQCLAKEKKKQHAVTGEATEKVRTGCYHGGGGGSVPRRRKAATAKGRWRASARLRFWMRGWGKNFIREHETLELHRTAGICLGRDERISARYEIGNVLGPW